MTDSYWPSQSKTASFQEKRMGVLCQCLFPESRAKKMTFLLKERNEKNNYYENQPYDRVFQVNKVVREAFRCLLCVHSLETMQQTVNRQNKVIRKQEAKWVALLHYSVPNTKYCGE